MRHSFCNRLTMSLLTLGFLSGCSISDRFLPSEEKIHRAFPPSAEVRVIMEDARETFRNETNSLKHLEERIRSQIQLRSLTCTQGLSIGRIDSIEKIKTLPVDQNCLAEQDENLAATVGTFLLAKLLVQPPLRPLTSLDSVSAVARITGVEASFSNAASHANVLLTHGSRNGELSFVEIPSGKTISSVPHSLGPYTNKISISPNGRLAAVGTGNTGVIFLDIERGRKLWEPRKLTQFYAWLPDVNAALVHDAKSSSPALLDLETGQLVEYAAAPKNLTWVTPTAEKGTVWLGSHREVLQVKYERTKGGLEATISKEFRLSRTQGITSQPPTLVDQGKTLFFVSIKDFSSLNLATGQETAWNVSDFLANRYAKLSETTLLVDSYSPNGGSMRTWVLDLTARTLAPVDSSSSAASRNGLLMGLPGRTGWLRRGSEITYLGDTVLAGEPQSLDELSSAFNIERQLFKIEIMERQEARVTEQMPQSHPRADLPRNAQVEAVGVYQGSKTPSSASTEARKMGTVDVRVKRTRAPVILVLSSYEPVLWRISLEPGAQLAGVLLSGYHQSQVQGAGAARVLQMGRFYAYQQNSREYNILNREVQSWTGGQGIKVFQGRYDGGSYTVGG